MLPVIHIEGRGDVVERQARSVILREHPRRRRAPASAGLTCTPGADEDLPRPASSRAMSGSGPASLNGRQLLPNPASGGRVGMLWPQGSEKATQRPGAVLEATLEEP